MMISVKISRSGSLILKMFLVQKAEFVWWNGSSAGLSGESRSAFQAGKTVLVLVLVSWLVSHQRQDEGRCVHVHV